MPNKVDSNTSGLRYAEETSVGVVSGAAIWYPAEPNEYSDFGGEYKQVARNPISAGRQRRKGTIVDKDTTAGFQTDFTKRGMYRLMQGFMFADWREKITKTATAVTTSYTIASTTGIVVNDLIFAEGFTNDTNNGFKLVTAVTGTTITAAGLVTEASPPAGNKVTKVGVQGAAADIAVGVVGGVPRLTSTTLNFTTLGIIPGEWLYIGGDAAATRYDTVTNNGFVRVKTVAANLIVLDRFPGTMVADAGTGKTIQLFVGHVIKNENDPTLIKTRSYQFERSYPSIPSYEYIKGAVANTLELKITNAEKLTVDLGFIATDSEDLGAQKAGTRPAAVEDEALNATNDVANFRMMVDNASSTLFTYVTEMTLTIDNGVEPLKAVGVLGGFDNSIGDFVVAGEAQAYFTSAAAVDAVRNNSDVSLDLALVKSNVGWLFDIPLLSLGDARRTVEKDKAVMLPLSVEAAMHATLQHTLLVMYYTYLPTVA